MKKVILLFVLLPTVLAAHRAQATFYTVTGTADNVDSATHGGSGTAGAPFQMSSLRGAIIAANANAGADTITLPAGTYTLTRVGNDANCQNGDLDINGSLTINGAGPAITIVQGATDAAFTGSIGDKIFGINQDGTFTNLTVLLSGMTIRYGRNTVAFGDPTFAYTGAGIDVFMTGTGNSITISNCVITGNENVNSYGGGINVDSGNSGLPGDPAVNTVNRGSVTIVQCTIANNKSLMNGAGANLFSDIHNVVFNNCVISNNVTTGLGGAGAAGGGLNIRHTYGGSVIISNNTFIVNNTGVGFGGGISVSAPHVGPVTIQNSTISGNTVLNNAAISSEGGGLYNEGLATVLTDIVVANNHADTFGTGGSPENPEGGGVLIDYGSLTITGNSYITNNTSVDGAGIFNRTANSTNSVTGATIAGNQAKNNGGGVGVLNGIMTMSFVKLLNNVANSDSTGGGDGGAIYVSGGTLTASFCRVVSNTVVNGNCVARTAGTATVTNNWWGTNNPAGQMSGTVGFTPWLQLTHTANPSTIFVPNSTTLTATFLTNSAGTAIALANLSTLIGLPITFKNAVRGVLSGAQTTIQSSGTATATFTANAAGAGSADVVVDNQATTASITIPTGLSSINRVQTTPTNLNSVSWTVTFTNAVSGVASGNFSLVNGGLGGAPAIASVTAVGGAPATTWTVTASTGSGTGTLGLNMANGAGVSATILNLPFTGQVCTIDLVAPALTCSTDIVVTAGGSCPAVVNYSVSVSDNLVLSSATTNPASGSVFPVGTNTVTLTARDTAGNTNFCTFKVTVLPGTAPQLSIVRSGTNIVVSWTNAYDCYALQSASALASNTWSLYPGPFATNGGNIYVTNSAASTNRFFRLTF